MAEAALSPVRWKWMRALRAFAFPLSALPVWVGTAAVLPPARWRWDVLLIGTLGVLLFHSAGNLLNDYFDYTSGADHMDEGDDGRPGRLLVRGGMTPAQVLGEALACLALSVPVWAYIVWRSHPEVLLFIAPAGLALYAYTGPPFRLKARALGEPLMVAVFGPLIVGGAAYAQTGRLPTHVVLLSVPVGMATACVLAANNLRDYDEDGAAGVQTLAQVIGRRWQRVVYLALSAGLSVGVALYGILGPASPVLAVAPALLLMLAGTFRRVWRGGRIPDVDVRTTRYSTAVMVFLLAVLMLTP
ncbi:MAG: prenyltransferase [Candidatus Brocadiia bacterium]